MLRQILCCVKFYAAWNFMLHQILWYVKFYAASNLMLCQISCCIKLNVASNFMLHQNLCCVKFYVVSNFMWHQILCYVKFNVVSNFILYQILCCTKFYVSSNLMLCQILCYIKFPVRAGLVTREEGQAAWFPGKTWQISYGLRSWKRLDMFEKSYLMSFDNLRQVTFIQIWSMLCIFDWFGYMVNNPLFRCIWNWRRSCAPDGYSLWPNS